MNAPALTVEECVAIARLLDTDADGRISAAEVERALADLGGRVTDQDAERLRHLVVRRGSLPITEVTACMLGSVAEAIAAELREIFTLADTDGSGRLGREELALLLEMLEPADGSSTGRRLQLEGDGPPADALDYEAFLHLVLHDDGVAPSLGDLRCLKKTLEQYIRAARSPRITLVEVDCDLGASIPGAGDGIALLRQAAERQLALRRLRDGLLEEIAAQNRLRGRASELDGTSPSPHARHIERIAPLLDAVADLVAGSRSRDQFPVVLGGDHSTAAGTIAGLRRAHPDHRLGVVWIDAHADIHSPFTTPSGNMHGMPLAIASGHDNLGHAIHTPDARILELWAGCQALAGGDRPAIELRDLVYVSVRATEPAEDALIAEHGIPVIRTEEVRSLGPEQAAARALEHLAEADLIYVSFDVDSLDATICKGTGTPVPGGLWAEEARELHRVLLRDPRVCCWEICEINPHLDTLNTMAELSLGVYRTVLEVLQERLAGQS